MEDRAGSEKMGGGTVEEGWETREDDVEPETGVGTGSGTGGRKRASATTFLVPGMCTIIELKYYCSATDNFLEKKARRAQRAI